MKFKMYAMVLMSTFSLMQASEEPAALSTEEIELDILVNRVIQKELVGLKRITEQDYAKSKQDYLKYKQIREQRKQSFVNYSNELCEPLESQDNIPSKVALFLTIASKVEEELRKNNVCDEKGYKDYTDFRKITNIVKPIYFGDATNYERLYFDTYCCWFSQPKNEQIEKCVTRIKKTMNNHIKDLDDLDNQRVQDLVKLRMTIDQQSAQLKMYPPLPQENIER